MANTLTNLMQTIILPLAMPVLREHCIMPALVQTDFDNEAKQQGDTIRIPGPQDLGDAQDMNTDTGSTSTALGDGKVDLVLDQWKYKQFEMTDKEMMEALTKAILPSAAEAAVKSLANAMGKSLLALYIDIPYFTGTAASTPDAALDLINARKILEANLAPRDARRAVIDVEAEAKFLDVFKDAAATGSTAALIEASLGRKFGLDTFSDQLIGKHTAGTLSAGSPAVNGAVSAGATTMAIDGGAGTETIKLGDVFTVAGASGTYMFTANATAASGAIAAATFTPAAPAGGFADNAAITIQGTHTPNLVFQRSAFALAARPLADGDMAQSKSSDIAVQIDPMTGIPLRLETWREPGKAKRFWRFDILYGVKTLRKELACRLIG